MKRVGEEFRNFLAALTMTRKLVRRSQKLRMAFDKGKTFTLQILVGAIFVVIFLQFRFVIEEFLLGWGTGHMEIDHTFGFRRKRWLLCGQRLNNLSDLIATRRPTVSSQKLSKCGSAKSGRGSTQKMSAR